MRVTARLCRLISLVGFVLATGSPPAVEAAPASCRGDLDAFLSSPNANRLQAISGANETECWAALSSSNKAFNKLIASVRGGDRWSAQYLADHLGGLGGGNLEDALRALGQFSTHDMERLLQFKKEGRISRRTLDDALIMLPLSTVDNQREQLKAMKFRRAKLAGISREDLAEEKMSSIETIDHVMAQIRTSFR